MDRKLVKWLKSQNQSGREIKKEVHCSSMWGLWNYSPWVLCAGAFWHWMPKSRETVLFCCHDIDHVTVTYLGRSSPLKDGYLLYMMKRTVYEQMLTSEAVIFVIKSYIVWGKLIDVHEFTLACTRWPFFLQPHACIWAPASSLGEEGVWPSAYLVLTDWNAIMANFIIYEHAISSIFV